MKLISTSLMVCAVVLLVVAKGPASATTQTKESANDLVYADFETTKYDRPASSRGGWVQLFSYQQNAAMPPKFKGLAGAEPPAPESVKPVKDDPNAAAAFDFEMVLPNQYEGVIMEVIGLPEKEDGKAAADDVSGYSYLTLQASATGVTSLSVEFLSQGQGIDISAGSPQASIEIKPGFNLYKIPLMSLAQPPWASTKVNPMDVLKKLTAINIIAACGPCAATKGRVVVDNIVFHR
jgi:hypothetical protein